MNLSNRVDDAVDWKQNTRARARIGGHATRGIRRDPRVGRPTILACPPFCLSLSPTWEQICIFRTVVLHALHVRFSFFARFARAFFIFCTFRSRPHPIIDMKWPVLHLCRRPKHQTSIFSIFSFSKPLIPI